MTRGLTAYAEMKDSGVDWLGDVPAHWEVRRLKSVVSQVSEQTDERQESMPYVALEHIESWTGRVSLHFAESAESQLKRFESGDILFGKLRPYLAKVARANCRGKCVGEFLVLRATNWISEHFLEHLLRSKPFIELPSLADQEAIGEYLDSIADRITRAVSRARAQIALLREYRTCLIADVVTGKLDVREAAPELPGTNAIGREEDGVDTIQAESHSHRAGHSIAEEANA